MATRLGFVRRGWVNRIVLSGTIAAEVNALVSTPPRGSAPDTGSGAAAANAPFFVKGPRLRQRRAFRGVRSSIGRFATRACTATAPLRRCSASPRRCFAQSLGTALNKCESQTRCKSRSSPEILGPTLRVGIPSGHPASHSSQRSALSGAGGTFAARVLSFLPVECRASASRPTA